MKLQKIIKSFGVIKAAITNIENNNKCENLIEAINIVAAYRPLALKELYTESLNNNNIFSINSEPLLLIKQRLSH